jgi:hypothetical protein
MNEKEIRERIERFLKKTARNVVVPASVSLGLSFSGCDSNALHAGAAEAGRDVATQSPDVADAALGPDLPIIVPPYLVYLPPAPDAGLEVAPEVAPIDATPIDVGAEMPLPPLPYLIFLPTMEDPELAGTAPLPVPPDEPK